MTRFVEVQRVGAYALVTHEQSVLLVRLSDLTSAPGRWTLPGGGIDPGEHPRDAVLRELYEEAGLSGRVVSLLGVDSYASTRPQGDDATERYHAIRVLYRVDVGAFEPLQIHDVGGSTDDVRWVPWDELPSYPLVPLAEWALRFRDVPGVPV